MDSIVLEGIQVDCQSCQEQFTIQDNDPDVVNCPHCDHAHKIIRPQAGPQTLFLDLTEVDIVIFGGTVYGGKTYALLLDPLHYVHESLFKAVLFRRTKVQIRNEGGLWDTSTEVYPYAGARPLENILEWRFPSGATVRASHMEHESNRYDWDGAQLEWVGFDQLEAFSRKQFFYLLSRTRSVSGIRPKIRGSCNPPDTEVGEWLKELLAPWIDEKFEEPAESGEVRYMINDSGGIRWVPEGTINALSITFVRSTIYDNKIGLARDPSYLAKLNSLPGEDRQRLLEGKWEIVREGGMFRREWFDIIEPSQLRADLRWIRVWDMAATEGGGCYTAGAKMATFGDYYFIADVVRDQLAPGGTDALQQATAMLDGPLVHVYEEREPGSSGIHTVHSKASTVFKGYAYTELPAIGDPILRAKPFASAAEPRIGDKFGKVKLVRGEWNADLISELVKFPNAKYKDQVAAISWGVMVLGGSAPKYDYVNAPAAAVVPRAMQVKYPQTERAVVKRANLFKR